MWIRFSHQHWHRFTAQYKRRFMPGEEHNLPTPVAQKAVDDGHAIKMKKRSRSAKPEPEHGEKA